MYFKVIIITSFVFITSGQFSFGKDEEPSYLEEKFRSIIKRPVFGYLDQEILGDNSIGITRFGLGIDGDIKDSLRETEMGYMQNIKRTQFCRISRRI